MDSQVVQFSPWSVLLPWNTISSTLVLAHHVSSLKDMMNINIEAYIT